MEEYLPMKKLENMNLIDSYVKIYIHDGFIETRDYDKAINILKSCSSIEIKYVIVQVFDNSVENHTIFRRSYEDAIVGIGEFFCANVIK